MISLDYLFFGEGDEEKLKKHFNIDDSLTLIHDMYEDTIQGEEIKITITPNRSKEDNEENRSLEEVPNFSFTYRESEHNLIQSKENTPVHGITEILEMVKRQRICQHEYSRPPINEEGDLDPTGIGTCNKCEHTAPDVLEPLEARLVSGNHKKYCYIAKQPWDEDTGLQCGSSGVVISKNPYQTAFFEAFPDIHGYGTFIRGEGGTIAEAESEAWQKYEKRINCPKHEFTREHRGKRRTDGYGVCIHCSLSSSDALEPETKCHKCGKPSSNEIMGYYECESHYFELALSEAIALEKKQNSYLAEKHKDEGFFSYKMENEDELEFNTCVEHTLLKIAFMDLGEKKYSKHESGIRSFIYGLEGFMLHQITGKSGLTCEEYPSIEDARFKEMLSKIESRFSEALYQYLFEKKSIKYSDLLS